MTSTPASRNGGLPLADRLLELVGHHSDTRGNPDILEASKLLRARSESAPSEEQLRQAVKFRDASPTMSESVALAFAKPITKAAGESAPAVTGGMESSLKAGEVKRADARVDGTESAETEASRHAPRSASAPTAATPGAYRWITDAVEALRLARKLFKVYATPRDDEEKHAASVADKIEALLSGVPTTPEDLGFDSPADRYARAWHALNATDFKNQGFSCTPRSSTARVIGFNEFLGKVQHKLILDGYDPPRWPDPTIRDCGDLEEALDCCVKWCKARLDEARSATAPSVIDAVRNEWTKINSLASPQYICDHIANMLAAADRRAEPSAAPSTTTKPHGD